MKWTTGMIAAITLLGFGARAVADPATGTAVAPQDNTPESTSGPGASKTMATATFGAGCFWGVEAAFREVKGVVDTAVGFMGGALDSPSYKDVCTGTTGHAEVVQVTYDPAVVSYEALLKVFWDNHDPTQYHRQGPDVGEQYRSVIFYYTPEQQKAAQADKERLQKSGQYKRDIATEIVPAGTFWRAEEYHQRFLEKHGRARCH